MYDNLDMVLYKDKMPGIDFSTSIPQFLDVVTSEGESKFGKYINGYLDSLKVSISDSRIKIHDSSICKYFLGDNFKTMGKGDTQKAIEKISNSLHLPFQLANITRIDFGQNFIMKYPEEIYYPYLGESQYYKRLEQNNGLYYNNQKRQLIFYGKEYEQRVKGQPIPDLYKNRNVIRYELRFKKRLTKEFNKPEIEAKLLYDEIFYKDLMHRWEYEYSKIQKINTKLISMKPTGSTKQFTEDLALFQILDLGQSHILSKVKEWQLKGEISKKQAYDLRKHIKEMTNNPIVGQENEFINELDQKIKEAARYS